MRLFEAVKANVTASQAEDFILEIGAHIKIKRELFGQFLDKATCV